jgi:uncharacterized membrane protein YccC
MKQQCATGWMPNAGRLWVFVRRITLPAFRAWAADDGLVWLHLLKTVIAALLALGIAMLLDLQQPRTAMTTVFVLMQPLSGMVLAKSFYRLIGTAAGMVAAIIMGAAVPQQPELYMLAMTAWVGACVALAVRYRHFRWYGFVLAGYTAVLIGIPTVMAPGNLFLAALTRAAEVTVGIACSSLVSALFLPRRSRDALQHALSARHARFAAFASAVLTSSIDRRGVERYFAELVDDVVGFDAMCACAAFEDPDTRSQSQQLARLNHQFMDICTRLYAFNQLNRRLRANHSTQAIEAAAPFPATLAQTLGYLSNNAIDTADAVGELTHFRSTLQPAVHEARRRLVESDAFVSLTEFDTVTELLCRLVDELIRYTHDCHAAAHRRPTRQQPPVRSASRTSGFVVALAFIRTAVVLAIVGGFWIETGWTSGGLAVVGAALACALSSSTPRATRFCVQMAVGAALATLTGYLYQNYIFPNIDGFPMLCVVLAPVLAVGAFVTTRARVSGIGIGFSVFFCLLAAPDNVTVFAPDLLINNGLSIVVSILITAIGSATIFPPDMQWLAERTQGHLRRQTILACHGALPGLDRRFHSGTHDLMFQLRALLTHSARQHRDALRWMLVTLEVGHVVIDLRADAGQAAYARPIHSPWTPRLQRALDDLAKLFEQPGERRLERALLSVQAATWSVQQVGYAADADRAKRNDQQRILGGLHFLRTVLLDADAPFARRSRR